MLELGIRSLINFSRVFKCIAVNQAGCHYFLNNF